MPSTEAKRTRRELTRQTSVRDFRDFYWLKSELITFCRGEGLPTTGGKLELAQRIEDFLRGKPAAAKRSKDAVTDEARTFNALTTAQLTMKTRIPGGARCTQALREFLQREVDPAFRFTVTLQRYVVAHPDMMLKELAAYWHEESAGRKSGAFRPAIEPQFEFNQFTRDYHADPANAGKTRRDCLVAWKKVRAAPGDNKYRR